MQTTFVLVTLTIEQGILSMVTLVEPLTKFVPLIVIYSPPTTVPYLGSIVDTFGVALSE